MDDQFIQFIPKPKNRYDTGVVIRKCGVIYITDEFKDIMDDMFFVKIFYDTKGNIKFVFVKEKEAATYSLTTETHGARIVSCKGILSHLKVELKHAIHRRADRINNENAIQFQLKGKDVIFRQ